MNLKQKVMSGLRWTAGGKFLGQLITWGITIVIIRLLSPSDYGLMSLTSVFVGFLAMLSELGMGAAVVQQKILTRDTLKSLFGLLLLVSVIVYLSLIFAAPLIADFYEEEVDTAVDNMTALMEPLIMAFLGVVIGGLVISMYLPIFQMAAAI